MPSSDGTGLPPINGAREFGGSPSRFLENRMELTRTTIIETTGKLFR